MCSRVRGSLAAVLRTEPRGGAPWPLPSSPALVLSFSPLHVAEGTLLKGSRQLGATAILLGVTRVGVLAARGEARGSVSLLPRLWEAAALLRGKSPFPC